MFLRRLAGALPPTQGPPQVPDELNLTSTTGGRKKCSFSHACFAGFCEKNALEGGGVFTRQNVPELLEGQKRSSSMV